MHFGIQLVAVFSGGVLDGISSNSAEYVVCDAETKEAWHRSEDGEDADTKVGEDGEFVDGAGGVLGFGERLEGGFSGAGLLGGVDGSDAGGDTFGSEATAG